jgi:pimeloyl-ACP methyl ester carboxylesterase
MEKGPVTSNRDPLSSWNIALPTLGGKQFWTDYRWWYGWRVQYNRTLNHWRIIDPTSTRRAWGSKDAMLTELGKIESEHQANQTPPEEVVVLLHGLIRSASSMKPLANEIRQRMEEHAVGDSKESTTLNRCQVLSFTYASTRDSVAVHAAAFREMMENLPGTPRWKAVGHSMGNIVLRAAIAQWQAEGDPKGVLARLQRVVMLGPPNQGSSFAKKLSQLGLFEMVTGNSGMQLGPQWQDFQQHLGVPPCPFAVIAGDVSQHPIQNPLLNGPSDGVVTVEESKLDGMSDFTTVPVLHSFLMQDAACVKMAVDYLLDGSIAKNDMPNPENPAMR